MEEPFKPLSLSIGELFGNKDALYKIPQYQRPYKWEDEQVDKLWDDIYDAFENNDDNYFLGSVITAKPRDNEKSAYVDVVDGQQRLTTLMILFCVIRDLYPEINKDKSTDNPFAVDLDTITASISHLGKADRLKLYTHSQHQSDFHDNIINGNTSDLKKPYKYQIRTDEEPKFKFINTAVIFRNKLSELGQEQSEELINYLFNQVKIIRIDCKNREFAIKLFQVLNDRGMDLTAADLIKSFLLEKLYSKYKDDQDTSKIKEERFISDWREMEQTIPVLYFTFDLSEYLLTSRFIASVSGIPASKILQHDLTDEERNKLSSIENELNRHKLFINDSYNNSLTAFKAHCQKQIEENGVKVIFVDYLQMMSSNKYRNSRELEISYISRELKNIAKDFNVCVIATSQLSRALESRGGSKHPQLSDLRESGAIEQDADKVIFIYRPEYYGLECDEEGNNTAGLTEIILAKNRNGSLGSIKLLRDNYFTNFRSFDTYKNDFSFSQNRLDEMTAKNPNLKNLIDKLDLESEAPF